MTPSAIQALRRSIAKLVPWKSGDEAAMRMKRSQAFAAAMRERGWLAEEGYAPGSWAK